MNAAFIVYIDFDSTLYDTPVFSDDLRSLIAAKTGLSVETIKQDGAAHFFHPTLGGYEYEKHIRRYGLDSQEMWNELDKITQSKNYLYPDSVDFMQSLKARGLRPKILTFGENKFQLAKIYPCLKYFGDDTTLTKDDIVVVAQKKNIHIQALHAGQRGVLIDDKPDQQLPPGFTEIHIKRGADITEPIVRERVVVVSDLHQAKGIIASLTADKP